MKKIITALVSIVLALSLFSGCTKKDATPTPDTGGDKPAVEPQPEVPQASEFPQLSAPKDGDQIAVFETSEGTFSAVLYPQYAPLAVENFVQLASKEYYKDMLFHRVVEGFVIQTGDPTGTGTGGKSASGAPFVNEHTRELHHFYGALGMANAGTDTNESQFYVVCGAPVSKEYITRMEGITDGSFPPEVIEGYKKLGGQPPLDYNYTVFGQVYEGMKVVEKIAKAKVDSDSRPTNDIKLISVKIDTFKAPKK
ncbi:MAG: peptidylprolyl isomerase [Oscillospiraceae bacterium]